MKVKFLIIRFSSMGDIVLTTPVVRALKQQVEGAEIHYAVKAGYASLLSANPHIDKIHLLHDRVKPLAESLGKENIDYIIDLHHNIRSGRLKRHLGVPSFTFRKLNLRKWLFVNFRINLLPGAHVVDRYMDTLSSFNVQNDQLGLEYFIPDEERDISRFLPEGCSGAYIVFVIGGTYHTKRLPVEKAAEICSNIDCPVVLLGGKNEHETGEILAGMAGSHVKNLCGLTNIHQSAGIIRDSRLVLTNDTGLMHIAAAFRKKILSFWGNTVPALGMSPYQPHPDSMILETGGLKCRPCSKLGYDQCPRKHFRCMNDIDTVAAIRWVNTHFHRVTD